MSIHSSNEVWAKSKAKGNSLLTLLAIADDANDNGVAWPSVQRIKDKTNQEERNVQVCLVKLVEAGELEINYNKGPFGTNLYRILIVEPKDPDALGGPLPPNKRGRPPKRPGEAPKPRDQKRVQNSSKRVQNSSEGVQSSSERVHQPAPDPLYDPLSDPLIDPLRDHAAAPPPPAEGAPPSTPVPDTARDGQVAQASVAKVRAAPAPKPTRIKESNRYFQRGDVLPEGRWPDKATADNPVKLYYCYWSMSSRDERLTAPQADDLAKMCPDLKRLDDVLLAYSRTPFRPRNLNLVFDWYLNGVPDKYRVAAAGHGDNALTNGIVAKGNHREEPQADATGQPADTAAADFWRNYYAQQQSGAAAA